MYAVIKTGGKQYRVQPGDVIVVEKLDGEAGSNVSFGDVLMLGGDNMDLALAHLVEQRLGTSGEGRAERLSAARLSQLVQRCRVAKEQLLAADAPDKLTVTLLGAGSRLIGGARSVELSRDEVERLIVDGFGASADEGAPFFEALRQAGVMLAKEQKRAPVLHLFLLTGQQGYIGLSYPENNSPLENGIMRLKFPPEAPSRRAMALPMPLLSNET